MSNTLTEDERAMLNALFDRGAARARVFDAYWIHGADLGEDYCLRCARKEVSVLMEKVSDRVKDKIFVDGGWRTEHDSQPFCSTCGRILDGSFTDDAVRDEIEHFLKHGFNPKSQDDCYSMIECVSTSGWEPSLGQVYQHEYERKRDRQFFADLHKLGRKILSGLSRQRKSYLRSILAKP